MHLLLNAEIQLQECWYVDKKSWSSSPRLVLLKLDVAVHVSQAIFIHVSIALMYDVHPKF